MPSLRCRVEEQVLELFATIEREVGPLEVVVFNIGANVRFSITETTERVYRKVWEMAALAGFLTGREAARVMLPRHAAPSFSPAPRRPARRQALRGFASAKFALRATAQSMARELGPQGIHVAHPIIDGAIDTAFIRDTFPEMYQLKDRDGILNPAYRRQLLAVPPPRDCWVHEMVCGLVGPGAVGGPGGSGGPTKAPYDLTHAQPLPEPCHEQIPGILF
ncbi:MAG: SDR family oxidoreductase [Pseudomonas sp.]|nr:SDR family oxidoreductase [Pseudomonas sp.]